MKIAAATMVLPRMEAPFIAEWCRYLALQGVEKLFLSIDQTPEVWQKKARIQYYCPKLDTAEFELYWTEQLQRAREYIEIEAHAVEAHSRNHNHLRQDIHQGLLPRLRAGGFDWLVVHDVDEFLVAGRRPTVADYLASVETAHAVLVRQLVFESRWDPLDDYRPRRVVDIRRYHPNVVPQTKYLCRPERVAQLGTHHCILDDGMMVHAAPDDLVLHHYRGVERAMNRELRRVRDFPATLARPLYEG